MEDNSLAVRKLANFVFQFAGGKGNFETYWPLRSTKEPEIIQPPSKEWWQQMKDAQSKIDKIIQSKRNK